jgi:hypothetical protein
MEDSGAKDALDEAIRFERQNAFAELSYLVNRADNFEERQIFGVLALNGASMIVLLSALGGSSGLAGFLHHIRFTATLAALCFLAGFLCASLSAFFYSIKLHLAAYAVWKKGMWLLHITSGNRLKTSQTVWERKRSADQPFFARQNEEQSPEGSQAVPVQDTDTAASANNTDLLQLRRDSAPDSEKRRYPALGLAGSMMFWMLGMAVLVGDATGAVQWL